MPWQTRSASAATLAAAPSSVQGDMFSARRLLSPRTFLAVLLPSALLVTAGVLAYLNASEETQVQAARQDAGIDLVTAPEPVTYSLAAAPGFEQYEPVIAQFASNPNSSVVRSTSPADIELAFALPAGLETEFAQEDLVLTVPIGTGVFSVSSENFRDIVSGLVTDWAQVGGAPGKIDLVLAAGPAAAPHRLPAELLGSASPTSTNFEVYAGLSTDRRALRVDGKAPGRPDYPFKISRSVSVSDENARPAALALAEQLKTASQAEPSVTLAAVGDLMLANVIAQNMAARGVDQPFAAVAPYLQQADITFGNLEGTFTERGIARPKNFTFRTPQSLAGGLLNAGFDLLSLGNNHMMDFGPEGLHDTIDTLNYLGIPHAGAGNNEAEARAPVILEANGLRIGFLAYVNVGQEIGSGYVNETAAADADSPGVAWARPSEVAADVAALRPQVDVVVISMHIGIEGAFVLREWQLETARAAIDAGAALVLGHHAHVLQRIEHYGEGVIIYGLGNFVFDVANPDLNNTRSVIAYFELTRDGVSGYDFVPAVINVFENRPEPVVDASGLPILLHILGRQELPPDPQPPAGQDTASEQSAEPALTPTPTATP
jgi:poly-gamma-glutamate capsule biosynthesis protein CapA/YwtB (metallophosphatase superfamily)